MQVVFFVYAAVAAVLFGSSVVCVVWSAAELKREGEPASPNWRGIALAAAMIFLWPLAGAVMVWAMLNGRGHFEWR